MKKIKKSIILFMLTLFFINPINIYAYGDPIEREWMFFGTDTYQIERQNGNCTTTTTYERRFFFGFVISVEAVNVEVVC